MIGKDDSRRQARLERKRLRLGTPDPVCARCGFDEPCCLRSVGKCPEAEILCENCRKKGKLLSERARNARLKRFAEAGYPEPHCFTCGEDDLRTLEIHHVAAEANSAFCLPSCANCHAIESDHQEDLSVDLRLRDPERRPLALQAAFDGGLAIVLILLAVASASATTKTFYGLAAAALIGWAIWNLAADQHFAEVFGPDYSSQVPAVVPS